jgi:nucleoside-diphosphate-sugar epimerase
MMRRVPDISKANGLIGYQPTIMLDEIIRSVVEYQTSKLERVASPLAF